MRSQDLRCYLILERICTLLLSKSFRMKNFPSILPLIKPNNEAISLDIQDAYLQVPILSSSWGGGHVPEGPGAPFGPLPKQLVVKDRFQADPGIDKV